MATLRDLAAMIIAVAFLAGVILGFLGLFVYGLGMEPASRPPPTPPITKPAPPPCYQDIGQKVPDLRWVRLPFRKLHLVRPDLILYPLFVEVYA